MTARTSGTPILPSGDRSPSSEKAWRGDLIQIYRLVLRALNAERARKGRVRGRGLMNRRNASIGSACAVLIGGLFLWAGAGSVSAEEPSEAQILNALQSRSTRAVTRSLAEQRRSAEERRILEGLRTRSARSLTLGDRARIAEIAKDKPSIDIEINFDYNSDIVGPKALRPLGALGRVLSKEQFKGTLFLVNGHTDGK